MKKLLLGMTFLLLSLCASAQTFNYQAAARDASGELLTNHVLGVQVNMLPGSVAGASVFSETYTVTTNENGVFSLAIGEGSNTTGNLSTLSWGTVTYFLEVSLDIDGGSSYSVIGASQLRSVPLAYTSSKFETQVGATNVIQLDTRVSTIEGMSGDATLTAGDFQLKVNSVGTDEVINGSLTSLDLGSSSVGQNQLQADAVGPGEIQNGAVQTLKMADGSVTSPKIGNGQVFNEDLNIPDITSSNNDNLAGTLGLATNTEVKNAIDGISGDVEVALGGASTITDAAVTEDKLSFDTATQVELDVVEDNSLVGGAVNTSDNGLTLTKGDATTLTIDGLATDTEVDGIRAGLQDNIDLKAPILDPTFEGTVTGSFTGALTGNADTVTTNANTTGDVTSEGNVTTIADAAVTEEKLSFNTATQDELDVVEDNSLVGGAVNTNGLTLTKGDATTLTIDGLATDTEVDGIRAGLQENIDLKAPILDPTFEGTVTGSFTGALTGNADTVTTNANTTGDVTSEGNVTTIADAAVTEDKLSFDTATQDELDVVEDNSLVGGAVNTNGLTLTKGDATTLTIDGLATDTEVDGIRAGLQENIDLKAPILDPTFEGTVTGSFTGALTGNADTVTTNANTTGDVTSEGNVTTIADGAVEEAMLAGSSVTSAKIADATIEGADLDVPSVVTALSTTGDLQLQPLEGAFENGDKTKLDGAVLNTGNQTIAGEKEFTSAIVANLTGNADTVTTNANTTGDVTSEGNVTTIADGAVEEAMMADSSVTSAKIANATIEGADLDVPSVVTALSDTEGEGLQLQPLEGAFEDGDKTKLDGAVLNTGNQTIAGVKTFSSAIVADVTGALIGNAATVTTNANTTGDVTSEGNVTTIADGAVEEAMMADSAVTSAKIADATIQGADLNVPSVVTALSTTGDLQLKPLEGAFENGDKTKLDAAVLNTGNQTIAGEKEFTSAIVANLTGNADTVTTNANTTGDVTSQGNETTIAVAAVTEEKLSFDTATQDELDVVEDNSLVGGAVNTSDNGLTLTKGDATTLTIDGLATDTEVDGIRTGLQENIDLKAPLANPTFEGTVTGSFTGALTGNADTVTTNANTTGDVTSEGNVTTIADGAVSGGLDGVIADGTISTDDIADGTISTDDIADGTIQGADLNPSVAGDGLLLDINNNLAVKAGAGLGTGSDGVSVIAGAGITVSGGMMLASPGAGAVGPSNGSVAVNLAAASGLEFDTNGGGLKVNLVNGSVSGGEDGVIADGTISTEDIADDTITGDDLNVPSVVTALSTTGDLQLQPLEGAFEDGDKTKLDGAVLNTGDEIIAGVKEFTSDIEGSVTGNAGTVTNGIYTTSKVIDLIDVFDAGSGVIISTTERNKFNTIETSATADQTADEIKTAYESNLDTNVFDNAAKTAVSGATNAITTLNGGLEDAGSVGNTAGALDTAQTTALEQYSDDAVEELATAAVATNTSGISTLNGGLEDAGSVGNTAGALDTAQTTALEQYSDDAVEELATAAVATNTGDISTLNGDSTVEGSVGNTAGALDTAQTTALEQYSDDAVEELATAAVATNTSGISTLNGGLEDAGSVGNTAGALDTAQTTALEQYSDDAVEELATAAVATNTSGISTLNGDSTVEGSVGNTAGALDTAQTTALEQYSDDAVEELATAAVATNTSGISTLNGDSTVEGSVGNTAGALDTAQTTALEQYSDDAVEELATAAVATNTSGISTLNGGLEDAGSVGNTAGALDTAQTTALEQYSDDAVEELATAAVATNTGDISTLNGDSTVEGSVGNTAGALDTAQTTALEQYSDDAVEELATAAVATNTSGISTLNGGLEDAGSVGNTAGALDTAQTTALEQYSDDAVEELATAAVATNTGDISTLNGDSTVEGSVGNTAGALDTAQTTALEQYSDDAVEELATAAVATNTSGISTLNGDSTVEGSVGNTAGALDTAQTTALEQYSDDAVEELATAAVATNTSGISTLNGGLEDAGSVGNTAGALDTAQTTALEQYSDDAVEELATAAVATNTSGISTLNGGLEDAGSVGNTAGALDTAQTTALEQYSDDAVEELATAAVATNTSGISTLNGGLEDAGSVGNTAGALDTAQTTALEQYSDDAVEELATAAVATNTSGISTLNGDSTVEGSVGNTAGALDTAQTTALEQYSDDAVEELATAAVATNTSGISTLNGDSTVEGSVGNTASALIASLNLGTAAVKNEDFFATALQGSKADTALQADALTPYTLTSALGTVIGSFSGELAGNAATVTTNANTTGDVTSEGNVTTIADGAVEEAMMAGSSVTSAKIADATIEGADLDVSSVVTALSTTGDLQLQPLEGAFEDGDKTKLDAAATQIQLDGVKNSALVGVSVNSNDGNLTFTKGDTNSSSSSIIGLASDLEVDGVKADLQENIDAKASLASPTFQGTVTGSFTGALTGNADTVTTNANTTGDVTSEGNVTTIAVGAVTTAKILDATIGSADLADNAVITSKILDGNVTSAKIANATIVAEDLALDAVSGGLNGVIADDTISTEDIADGTIQGADLDPSLVGAGLLFGTNNNVLSVNAGNGIKVSQASMVSRSGAVASSAVEVNLVATDSGLEFDTMGGLKVNLVNGSVTSAKIADATIEGADLDVSSVVTALSTTEGEGLQLQPSEGAFEDGDKTKLDGAATQIELDGVKNNALVGVSVSSDDGNLTFTKGDTNSSSSSIIGLASDEELTAALGDYTTTAILNGSPDVEGSVASLADARIAAVTGDVTFIEGDFKIGVDKVIDNMMADSSVSGGENGVIVDGSISTHDIADATIQGTDLDPSVAGDGLLLDSTNNNLAVKAGAGLETGPDGVSVIAGAGITVSQEFMLSSPIPGGSTPSAGGSVAVNLAATNSGLGFDGINGGLQVLTGNAIVIDPLNQLSVNLAPDSGLEVDMNGGLKVNLVDGSISTEDLADNAVNEDKLSASVNTSLDKADTALQVGDTALLAIGTSATTALAGDTALLAIGTDAGTALAGDTTTITTGQAQEISDNSAKESMVLGTSATTALAGDTPLLAIGTDAGTALAGDTALLAIGTDAGTALAGDTALLAIGTDAGTALAGDTTTITTGQAQEISDNSAKESMVLGTSATTALAGDTPLLAIGTDAGTALAGDTALLAIGTDAGTALAGDTALLAIGTDAGTALAGDTTTITTGQAQEISDNSAKESMVLGTSATTALAGDTPLLAIGTDAGTALAGDTTTITTGQAQEISDNTSGISTLNGDSTVEGSVGNTVDNALGNYGSTINSLADARIAAVVGDVTIENGNFKIGGGKVLNNMIALASVSGGFGGIIADGSITKYDLAANAVTGEKIVDLSVTAIKIADRAVNEDKLSASVNTSLDKADTALQVGDTALLAIGTSATTALAGDTPLLAIGTDAGTALAGDTALLAIGTDAGTALAGDTALLAIGTDAGTALAGDTTTITTGQAQEISDNSAKESMVLGTSATTALAGDTPLLAIGTDAGTALAGDTALLAIGTDAGTALAGDTALLAIGTDAGTALAGDTTTITTGQAQEISDNSAKESMVLGTSATTALAGDTPLLAIGTDAGTALAGDTALLAIGTDAGTALAGDTALLAIGTDAGTALAGDTTTITTGQAQEISDNSAKVGFDNSAAGAGLAWNSFQNNLYVRLGTGIILENGVVTLKVSQEQLGALQVSNDQFGGLRVKDGGILTTHIGPEAVITSQIAEDAVTSDKIASDAVTVAKIADLNVTTEKIADDAVTDAKLSASVRTSLAKADTAIQAQALGTAATTDANAYATKVQGEQADTALQLSDLGTAAVLRELDENFMPLTSVWAELTHELGAVAQTAGGLDTAQTLELQSYANDAVNVLQTGAVATNTSGISTLNGGEGQEGSVGYIVDNALGNYGSTINSLADARIAAVAGDVTIENGDFKIGGGKVLNNMMADASVSGGSGGIIADGSITKHDFASGAVAGGSGGTIADGSIEAFDLAANAVTTAKIADLNVTTSKIANANVTSDKLATSAVTTTKIADLSVLNNKIADDAVTEGKLSASVKASLAKADTAIQAGDPALLAIGTSATTALAGDTTTITTEQSDKITDNTSGISTLNGAVEQAGSVGYIVGNALGNYNSTVISLADARMVAVAGDVTFSPGMNPASAIGAGKVKAAMMDSSSVSGGSGGTIADGSIEAFDLAANAVTTAKIAEDAVTEDKLSASVNASLLKADTAIQQASLELYQLTSDNYVLSSINKIFLSSSVNTSLDKADNAAPTADPTFTGTVGGLTAAMVGLEDVDNISDADKPVSTATGVALDLKAPLASPQFTGAVNVAAAGSVTADRVNIREVLRLIPSTNYPTNPNDGDFFYKSGFAAGLYLWMGPSSGGTWKKLQFVSPPPTD